MTHGKRILVIGSSNTDMTVKGSRIPVHGETVLGGEFCLGQGGKGANQAVAAARLGGNVEFICKVGRDGFGEDSIKGYKAEGMDVSHTLVSEKPSGVALIMVDEHAENIISVAAGANGDFSVEDVESLAPVIGEADYLILQLEIPMDTVTRAAEIAHQAGVYVILNPAPAAELPEELLRNVSLIIPNQTESAALTGVSITDSESAEKAVAAFMAMGIDDAVITLGSRGSLVCTGGEMTLIPVCKVDAVDTTAAGDTFCGAVCVGLAEGKTLMEAVKFATLASSYTVRKIGAQSSIPHRADLA